MDDALSEFYAENIDSLTRFAASLVGPSEAADVVGDAIVRLIGSEIWVGDVRNRRALMFRAVFFEARMLLRGRGRRRNRERRAAQPNRFEIPEVAPEVARAVSGLSPQQRAAIFLTYWEDMSSTAIAQLLGVREGTVRKQLGRARTKLREVLDEPG